MSARLDPILDHARARAAALRASGIEAAWRDRLAALPATRPFAAALRRTEGEPLRVIAELKRRSPSAGPIREDLDPVEVARALEGAGAHALSVLTEDRFFGGDLDFLARVRAAVDLPLLRKDFVVDPLQVLEARIHGADAVLLLAVVLDDEALVRCAEEAARCGLDVLAETHDDGELQRVLALDFPLVGVNARDLRTFEVDLETALHRCRSIGADRIVVAESGIRTRADARRASSAGVDAVLVGEGLMRPGRPAERFAALFGEGP